MDPRVCKKCGARHTTGAAITRCYREFNSKQEKLNAEFNKVKTKEPDECIEVEEVQKNEISKYSTSKKEVVGIFQVPKEESEYVINVVHDKDIFEIKKSSKEESIKIIQQFNEIHQEIDLKRPKVNKVDLKIPKVTEWSNKFDTKKDSTEFVLSKINNSIDQFCVSIEMTEIPVYFDGKDVSVDQKHFCVCFKLPCDDPLIWENEGAIDTPEPYPHMHCMICQKPFNNYKIHSHEKQHIAKLHNETQRWPFTEFINLMNFRCFKSEEQIKEYWILKNRSAVIKDVNFECVQKLTFRSFGSLDYNQWVNDEVINIYLEMLDGVFLRQAASNIRLMDSFFISCTLEKDFKGIERFLRKKNINNTHKLILPINNLDHWFFVIFNEQECEIFDSLKHELKFYYENQIFTKILKLHQILFECSDYNLVLRMDFPQQNNNNDCGIFMLMGIRDIIIGKEWSFGQPEIHEKRLQIANEILYEKLIL